MNRYRVTLPVFPPFVVLASSIMNIVSDTRESPRVKIESLGRTPQMIGPSLASDDSLPRGEHRKRTQTAQARPIISR